MTNTEQSVEDLREQIDNLTRQLKALKVQITHMHQPCTCDPPGSRNTCNGYCHVRAWLQQHYRGPGESVVVQRVDAAVQAVRAWLTVHGHADLVTRLPEGRARRPFYTDEELNRF